MKDETCKTLQPEPGQTLQQAMTLLAEGWQAARRDEPEDETMPLAWLEGHRMWSQHGRFKAGRLGLLQ